MMHGSPGSIELRATAYASAGRRSEAIRLINELKERRQKGHVPAGAFINPYLALTDYDEAFVWFERAYQEQSVILQFLKLHPSRAFWLDTSKSTRYLVRPTSL